MRRRHGKQGPGFATGWRANPLGKEGDWPLHIVVVGFDDLKSESEIAGELKRLRSLEIVRLVDVVVVAKSKGGGLVPVKAGALSQGDSAQFGASVGALVGLEDGEQGAEDGDNAGDVLGFVGEDQTRSVPDAIPAGSLAVVALIEHRWAIPFGTPLPGRAGRLGGCVAPA